jgi:uncharacterized protein YcfJ
MVGRTISLSIAPIALAMSLISCSPATTAGTVGGGAVGAGAGAIIGHQSGNAGRGAAIGGATGAIIGAGVGLAADDGNKRNTEEDEVLIRQQREIERQEREIEDLKRQRYHDDLYRRRIAPPAREESAPSPDLLEERSL